MLLDYEERQKKKKLVINLYLIIYCVLLVKAFLDTTMFKITWPDFTTWILLGFALYLISFKVLLIDENSKRQSWFNFFLAVCFLGSFLHTGYISLAFDLLLIVGALNVPFKSLITLYCIIAGPLLVFTMVSSQVGLVENIIYGRSNSFGIIYPTDFTAYIFYLVMGYCYLRKSKLGYPELAGILGLSIFSYAFCHSRNNTICLLLAFAIFLYLKVRNQVSDKSGSPYVMNPKFSRILTLSMPISALCFIGLTFLYRVQASNIILITINSLVSDRLRLGSIGIGRYGIQIFGSTFDMFGWGGSNTYPHAEYFFLDSSYVMILLCYGILVFLAVMIIWVLSSLRAEKQKDITLLWILALIAIQCMLEHHLLEIAYNPFLFLIFSKTGSVISPRRTEPPAI